MTAILPVVCNIINIDNSILKSKTVKMCFKTKMQFANTIVLNRFCSQTSLKTLGNKEEYSLKYVCPIWKMVNNDHKECFGVYQKQIIKAQVNLKLPERYLFRIDTLQCVMY